MWWPDLEDLAKPTRWAPLTLRQYIVLIIIAIGLLSVVELARAQPARWTEAACTYFARFALQTANVRDAGAQPGKHLKVLRRTAREQDLDLLPIFERELLRVHAEGLAPEDAEASAYTRCMTGEILRAEG